MITDSVQLASTLIDELKKRNLTLSTAESCTGGNIAHKLTEISGASCVYIGSVVAYSNEIKHNVLGVSTETLSKYGAVSEPTVRQMLTGVTRLTGTTCAVATSGIAGPSGGTPDKPVGTVCIGAMAGRHMHTDTYHFTGTRTEIINQATHQALAMILNLCIGTQDQ